MKFGILFRELSTTLGGSGLEFDNFESGKSEKGGKGGEGEKGLRRESFLAFSQINETSRMGERCGALHKFRNLWHSD